MLQTQKTAVNMMANIMNYAVLTVLNLVVRSVFNRTLGLTAAGLDTFFKSAVSFLSLAEMGMSTGLLYKLYRPVNQKDYQKIAQVMHFYRTASYIICGVIVFAGTVLCFCIHFMIRDGYSAFFTGSIFFFYVLDTGVSYLCAHKRALFNASQKGYVLHLYHCGTQTVMTVLQVAVLYLLGRRQLYWGFLLFAVIKVVLRWAENLVISRKFNRLYRDKLPTGCRLPGDEKTAVLRNVGAMFCHRIRWFCANMSASLMIPMLVSATVNGIYGNYTLITSTLLSLTDRVFSAIGVTFGGLYVSCDRDYVKNRFDSILLLNYFLYSFFACSVFNLLPPFIKLWLGAGSPLFDTGTFLLILLSFYLTGMRKTLNMARDSAGLYSPDKKPAVFEGICVIAFSILFGQFFGLNGILLGGIFSAVIPYICCPLIVYRLILKAPVHVFYVRFCLYAVLTASLAAFTWFLCSLLPFSGLFAFLCKGVLCCLIPNAVNGLIFYRTKEFHYLKETIKTILRRNK